MYQNGLIKKIRLISNFMTSQPGYCNTQIVQYSRSKDNQTMKFGLLIECNMRNIFLEKSYTKYDGETSPRPFSEKLKLTYHRIIQFVFPVWQVEGHRNISKLSCRPCAFTSYQAFLKSKKRSRTSLPASFSA